MTAPNISVDLECLFRKVPAVLLESRKPDVMALQKYDIRRRAVVSKSVTGACRTRRS